MRESPETVDSLADIAALLVVSAWLGFLGWNLTAYFTKVWHPFWVCWAIAYLVCVLLKAMRTGEVS